MFDFLRNVFRQRNQLAIITPAGEQAIVSEVAQRYRRLIVDRVGPLDRQRAEGIVSRMYSAVGEKSPKFIWCDSPEDGLIAASILVFSQLLRFDAANCEAVLLGKTIRRALMPWRDLTERPNNPASLAWRVSGLRDVCAVLRRRVGERGLRSFGSRTKYSLDAWLPSYLQLEENFKRQSEEFARDFAAAASSLWVLSEAEHGHSLITLAQADGLMELGSTVSWIWSEPNVLCGSFESIYVAVGILSGAGIGEVSQSDSVTGGHRQPDFDARNSAAIGLLQEYSEHCGWCFPFANYCIMSDRPSELFTLAEIESEFNIEVRRVMTELYGIGRYIQDTHAELIHEDKFGKLYRKPAPEGENEWENSDEDLVVVQVTNSTREPDGTYRQYFLRVPPGMQRARQAVAWTFGMSEEEYQPAFET